MLENPSTHITIEDICIKIDGKGDKGIKRKDDGEYFAICGGR